jgi:sugar phosphate isomerase/epimerase
MLIGGRAHSLEEAKHVGKAHLDFAEINLFNPHHDFQEIPSLLKLKEKFNFFFIVHGPEEGNPFDCQELKTKLLPQIEVLVDFAHELDAKFITIHFWLDQRFIKKTILIEKLDILEKMMSLANKRGMKLCLENLSERTIDLEQAFHRFPELGLTLDIGHSELLTSENTAYSFIETYPERIKHVHIHDNCGGSTPDDDLHLPLGEGTIAFEPILQALRKMGYDRTITLEVAPEFFKAGKEKLVRMLNTCNAHR